MNTQKNMIIFIVIGFMGCASLKNKNETPLLLEEIQKEETINNIKKGESIDPNLLWESAKIEKRWVPDQFKGNRVFVPGYFEYVVISPGHWKTK